MYINRILAHIHKSNVNKLQLQAKFSHMLRELLTCPQQNFPLPPAGR